MDSTENKVCDREHCCDCNGCGPMCTKEGVKHKMKGYWVRHLMVLVFGVIAAFVIGYHLGIIMGHITAGNPNAMRSGWMHDNDR